MTQDDVVREVRSARDEYARKHGYNVRAMVQDLREQERTGGREVVRLPRRRPTQTAPAATSGNPS